MADPIYDEEKKPAAPVPGDLKQQEQAANDDPYKTDYGSDEQRDEGPQDQVAQEHPSQVGRGYRPNKINGQGRFKSLSKRKGLLLAAGGSSLLLVVVGFLAFFLPALKIPQLAYHIEQYRLVRLTRTFYKQSAILIADKAAIDAAGGKAQSLLEKNKTGVKMASLRPQAVINNMKATGILSFETTKGILGAEKITAVKLNINGQQRVIEAPKPQFGRPIANYKDRLRFASQLNQGMHDVLRGNNYFVRSQTSKKLLSAWGIQLRWYELKGAKFFGLSQEKADQLALQETRKKISTTPKEGAKISGVSTAAKEANQAIDDCLAKADCNRKFRATGELPPEVTGKIDGIVKTLTSKTAYSGLLSALNTIYAIGLPVCIVYDGSVQASKAFVNSQNEAAIKTFLAIASADSQQKKGDVTAQAVGAFNRRIGDITDSIPEKTARGQAVDTSFEVSPQAARSGEFSIFDVLFPKGPIGSAANFLADNLCPTITNTGLVAGIAAANLVATIFIGPAEKSAEIAAKSFIGRVTAKISEKFTTPTGRAAIKNTSKKFAAGTGKFAVATEGATYLARMLVLAEMGAFYNGLGNDTLANQADAGGVAYAQEMQRQQLYGRPLTNEEVNLARIKDNAFIAQQKAKQSNFEKFFALNNPDSVAASLAMEISELNMTKIASFFMNIPKVLATIFSPLTNYLRPAVAADAADDNTNYKIVQWGWSAEEEKLIDNESFGSIENAQILADSGQADAILEEYGKCFSNDIGELLTDGSVKRDSDGNLQDEGLCSPKNLGPNNSKYGDLVFRWRLDQSYKNVLDDRLGTQNPETSVATTSSVSPGSTASTPITSECAEGSEDVGVHDCYENYNKIRIKLCAIDGLIIEDFTSGKEGAESTPESDYYIPGANNRVLVDATVSQKIVDMVRAAKADGVTLKAFSSYRTYEHQKKLASGGGAYAAAGDSKHQRGFAIDFIDSNQNSTANCRNIPGHTVNGRCVAPGDRIWEWLNKNASRFGYEQLINESWHWSPDGQ